MKLYKKNIFGKIITHSNIIPDIAGRFNEFKSIWNSCKSKDFILLGDLIDRGPNSKEVLDFVMMNNIQCVFANHEHIMIDFYKELNYYKKYVWFYNGGVETLLSFRDKTNESDVFFISDWIANMNRTMFEIESAEIALIGLKDVEKIAAITKKMNEWLEIENNLFIEMNQYVKSKIDIKYIEFLEKLPKFIEIDNVIFSHAPIFPGKKVEEVLDIGSNAYSGIKSETSILWNRRRPQRINDKLQIHGHLGLNKSPEIYKDVDGIFGLSLDSSKENRLYVYVGEEDSLYYVDYEMVEPLIFNKLR